jgi:WD40 repeat protein
MGDENDRRPSGSEAPMPLRLVACLVAGLTFPGLTPGAAPPCSPPPLPSGARARLKVPLLDRNETARRLAGHITCIAFSPDGRRVATASLGDSLVRLWDPTSGRLLRQWQGREKASPIPGYAGFSTIAISPDGKTLATAPVLTSNVELRDVATGKLQRTLAGHHGSIRCLAFSPDGQMLVAGDDFPSGVGCGNAILPLVQAGEASGRVRLWEQRTGRMLKVFKGWNWGPVTGVGFRPEGRTLVTCSNAIHFWNLPAGTLRRRSEGRGRLALSGDGRLLACISGDGQEKKTPIELVVVETLTGAALFRKPIYPSGKDTVLAFSPGGEYLATGAEGDPVVRLWDAIDGKEGKGLAGHSPLGVSALAFSPDGGTLATGSAGEGTMFLWDLRNRFGPRQAADVDFPRAWRDLGSKDPRRAYQALRLLAGDPTRSVAHLARRLPPASREYERRLKRLVAELDADDFATRQRASADLARAGGAAEPLLRAALAGKPSLELNHRAEQLLRQLQSIEPDEDELRHQRAVAALERIDSAAARSVLLRLAGGVPTAPLTRDAAESLRRMVRKRPNP